MPNNTLNTVLSDFLVNLAAGWFGAIFITPNYSDKKRLEKAWILTVNFVLAIVCLMVASIIRN